MSCTIINNLARLHKITRHSDIMISNNSQTTFTILLVIETTLFLSLRRPCLRKSSSLCASCSPAVAFKAPIILTLTDQEQRGGQVMISKLTKQYSTPLLGVSDKQHLHDQKRQARHLIKE